jgi:L-amino acid N-acyltransferase YncA
MTDDDSRAVLAVYAEGIAEGLATFETTCPSWSEWDTRHHRVCRLVCEQEDRVVGWAALSPISDRRCYEGVAEVSVYVASGARRRGVGRRLLQAVIMESEQAGFWTLQGATFEENTASLALQERCGFRVVGRRHRIARLRGEWKSTILTERRSDRVSAESLADETRQRYSSS